jgi:glycogen debranching enzyme
VLKPKPEPKPEPLFDIAVTSSSARPRYTMKQDDAFLVLDSHGDMGVSAGGPDGLFLRDTRYLSRFELLVNGVAPLVLGSTLSNDSCVLRVDLTSPDFRDGDLVVLSKNLLHIGRTLFISRETLHQRLTLHNYGAETIQLLLSLAFESDFADVFEVRGVVRGRRGTSRTEANAVGATLAYAGRDGVIRRTSISFDPKPLALTENCASYRIDLTPHSAASLYTTVACDSSPEGTLFLRAMRRAHLERKRRMRVETKIHTSNHSFNEMLRRATSDLAMLLTETPQGYYP